MEKRLAKGFRRYLTDGKPNDFLKIIRQEIKNKGLTQRVFAAKISMPLSQLRYILIYGQNPTLKSLRTILNGLDLIMELRK